MKIEVWSDIACPFCYIGIKNLQTAIKNKGLDQKVTIQPKSFELNPNQQDESHMTYSDVMMRKYGWSQEQADKEMGNVEELGRRTGLDMNMDRIKFVSTKKAHQLIHEAALHNKQLEAELLFFDQYFTQGNKVDSEEVITNVAAQVGISEERAKELYASKEYLDAIYQDQRQAAIYQISSVPFFLVGRKGLSGCRSVEEYEWFLDQVKDVDEE